MKNSLRWSSCRLLFAMTWVVSFGLLGCSQVAAPAVPAAPEKRVPAVGFQGMGVGMGNINPENQLLNLDEAVGLTPEQKVKARAILQREADELNALAPAERMEKGMPIRQGARDELRALLTPGQQKKQDALRKASQAQDTEERNFVTGVLRSSKDVSARLGEISSLSFLGSSVDLSEGRRRGRFTFTVIGSTGSDTLRVFWERKPTGGRMQIVKIETADGSSIQP